MSEDEYVLSSMYLLWCEFLIASPQGLICTAKKQKPEQGYAGRVRLGFSLQRLWFNVGWQAGTGCPSSWEWTSLSSWALLSFSCHPNDVPWMQPFYFCSFIWMACLPFCGDIKGCAWGHHSGEATAWPPPKLGDQSISSLCPLAPAPKVFLQ